MQLQKRTATFAVQLQKFTATDALQLQNEAAAAEPNCNGCIATAEMSSNIYNKDAAAETPATVH